MAQRTDIRKLDSEQLKALVVEMNEPAFRAKQLDQWLWKKAATSFHEMTDLPKAFREKLEERTAILPITIATQQKSADGTIKLAFKLHDGHLVEGVLIPTSTRITACISSQVGCSLSCAFCATGKMARARNLEAGEIFDQVTAIAKLADEHFQRPLTNIVYMGMGEPLLNYSNMMRSIEHLTSPVGRDMSPKRITVSTAGIAKMIERIADDGGKFGLALSLHAANDEKRNSIMPINEQNTLERLTEAMRYYTNKTGLDITFEYILFRNFNDSLDDAQELVRYCSAVNAKVNLIEYNSIGGGRFLKSDPEQTKRFQEHLLKKGITAYVRRSRGQDIDAACGQLANK